MVGLLFLWGWLLVAFMVWAYVEQELSPRW